MENILKFKNPIQRFQLLATKSFSQLSKMKEQDDRESFNQLMVEIMPSVQLYLNQLLTSAIRTGQLPSGKYKVDDFSDEVFIAAYDRFEEVKDESKFREWLFKLAYDIWDNIKTEQEFDNFFFTNIDQYTQVEWDSMEEKYSIDGDGDLVPDEEADEPVFKHYDYTLKDVFVEDNEEDFIEKISRELNSEQIISHINLILKKLPVQLKSAFELSRKLGFELEQIAKIKDIPLEEVQENVRTVEGYVRTSFEKRFDI